MRIGQAPASARQQAGGARLNQPIEGRTPNFSGGGDGGASALFSAAGALAGAANSLYEEDQKKRDFGALQMFNQMVGESERWQTEMFTTAPADGTGVSAASAQEWDKRFNTFLSNIDPDLQPRYTALGETVKQDFLKRGEETERAALRGNSAFVIDNKLQEAVSSMIDDPSSRDAWEQQGLALIQSAPGLTAADQRDYAEKFDRALSAAFVSGALYQSGKASTILPDDEAGFIKFRDAVEFFEKEHRTDRPHGKDSESEVGASGVMQVMPGTARDIAREIGDVNFPAGENDEVVKAYLKSSEAVGRRYGTYYLRNQLSEFGGDIEAAAIAYNAGPGNARRWLAADRDYSVLPQREQTEPYVRKIMKRMGIFLTSDTQLRGIKLSAGDRLQALSTLDARAQTQAAAALEQYQTETNNRLARASSAIMLDPAVYEDERHKIFIRIESSGLPAAVIEQHKRQAESQLAIARSQDAEFSLGALAAADNLDPETLTRIRDEMGRRRAAEEVKRKQTIEIARKDLVANRLETIASGNGGMEVVQALVDSGWIRYGDENYNKLKKAYTEKWDATNKFARGDVLTDAEANGLLINTVKQGLTQRDEGAVNSLLGAAQSFGFVPSEARDTLRNLLNSSNVGDVTYAAQAFAQLGSVNSTFLDRLSAEDKARIALAEQLQRTQVPAPQAAELLQAQRDPQRRQVMESMKKSDPAYEENSAFDPNEFANTFNLRALGITLWRNANSPASVLARSDLQLAYKTLFDAYYTTLGDAEDAKKRAITQMSRLYSPTQVGGTQEIIYMPPELTLSNVTSASGLQYNFTPDQTVAHFRAAVNRAYGFKDGEKFIVRRVAGVTEQAFFDGKEPPYQILPVNDAGEIAMPAIDSVAYEKVVRGEPFQFSWDDEIAYKNNLRDKIESAKMELRLGIVNKVDQNILRDLLTNIDAMLEEIAVYGE